MHKKVIVIVINFGLLFVIMINFVFVLVQMLHFSAYLPSSLWFSTRAQNMRPEWTVVARPPTRSANTKTKLITITKQSL